MSVEIEKLQEKLKELSLSFKLDALRAELEDLDRQAGDPNLWNDQARAKAVSQRRSECSALVGEFKAVETDLRDSEEFAALAEDGDAEVAREIEARLARAKKALDDLEFRQMLSGEMDHCSAIVSINSGAGGTESQDWVSMLLRMYLRWAEKHGYTGTVIDSLAGDGAGFKNVTITIEGSYAYGYLKAEQGVHRLVRISPFDANARRHTSFASVSVLPEVDETIEIEIKEEDLRIDTYRAGGAGGQHVNKTDSAVRLTHLPTGLVVACQNERSQHKNKASAMKVLKARLYELELQKREAQKEQYAGDKKGINFGSQIRSYTLQPYQLIKDHRTDVESGNVQAVLDGQIDEFIRAYLLQRVAA